jgi:UDP-glucose 4-epimerase
VALRTGPTPTVVVTGGCGFIGVNLGRRLCADGWRAVAFDDLSTGQSADAEAAGYDDLVIGDVRSRDALGAAVADADAVVHLAAHAGVLPSVRDPLHDLDVNVHGTVNALLAAREAGVRSFVFASSNAPLGTIEPPAREDVPARPLSPYGASKLAGEGYSSAFAASYGLPTTVLRFSNVYGPFSHHKGSVVATFLKAAAAGEPLVVFGDGEQTRDFVYVDDVARGIQLALEASLVGETFHLGTGREVSLCALVAEVVRLFPEGAVSVHHEPARRGEVVRSYADISRARRLLGYEPRVGLAEGLALTRDWFAQVETTTRSTPARG